MGKLDLRSLQLFRSLFSVLAAGYHHLALGILKLLMLWPHSNPTIRILGEGPRLPTQFLKFLSVNQAAKIKNHLSKTLLMGSVSSAGKRGEGKNQEVGTPCNNSYDSLHIAHTSKPLWVYAFFKLYPLTKFCKNCNL